MHVAKHFTRNRTIIGISRLLAAADGIKQADTDYRQIDRQLMYLKKNSLIQ